MATPKHSPGPWFHMWNGHYWEIRNANEPMTGEGIGDACGSNYIWGEHFNTEEKNPIAEHNARVMAASPELLEASQAAKALLSSGADPETLAAEANRVLALLGAAIAKAGHA